LAKNTNPELEGELIALRDFFAYNTFVRKRYLSLIVKLPKAALAKDRGASFPTILDIQTHTLDVLKSWLNVYETGKDTPELKGLSLSQVKKLESEVDDYIEGFMQKLSAGDLKKPFQFTAVTGKKIRVRSLGDVLWHLIEEELQHRGELNALLWQDDIDPPVTGWLEWRKESQKSKGT
jgi:uncharacterized damage-inducible protein DinB